MKRFIQGVVAACCAGGALVTAQSVAELKYQAAADVISLPAYGEVAGVATNSRGHVFVYARTGHPVATLADERTFYHGNARLFEFDPSGKFVKEIGQGTYGFDFAQQVRIDPQDNIWAVDAGSNVLTKFAPDGRLLMVIGRKPEAIAVRPGTGVPARLIDDDTAKPLPTAGGGGGGGGEGGAARPSAPGAGTKSELFNRPTDVAFDKEGNVYIADGMGTNNRIAVFNRDGNWVRGWGQTGSAPGEFNKIRGIALDAAGNVYVADSGNQRIQVFDSQGAAKTQLTGIGSPQAICISGGSPQYLYSSNSNDPESMENGEIYKLQLDGKIVGRFGKAGKIPGEFGMVNSLDCRNDNTVWVGEVWNWRATKVTLSR
jgi:DNA-binding beta-propeller fold protein YncE